MTDRQLILETVRNMPETASFAEILNELRLLHSVKQGLAETKRGEFTQHEDVVKKMGTWIEDSATKSSNTPDARAKRRLAAIKNLASINAFSSILDVEEWQRKTRNDRERPL